MGPTSFFEYFHVFSFAFNLWAAFPFNVLGGAIGGHSWAGLVLAGNLRWDEATALEANFMLLHLDLLTNFVKVARKLALWLRSLGRFIS